MIRSVPSGALSWNDADDNNAFHSKLFVMDLDGTISTEVAIKDKDERSQVATLGQGNKNDGTPMTPELGIGGAFIPKGAKAIDVAKEFMTYMIKPDVSNGFLKEGLGRWLPTMPSIVKSDPFWTNGDPQVKAYAAAGMLSDTVANYPVFNPGWAEVNATQVWGAAEADIIRNGATPEAAADAALKKIETILAKYPIVQS
jgi:multiple sugar transport system substrate-binding protein